MVIGPEALGGRIFERNLVFCCFLVSYAAPRVRVFAQHSGERWSKAPVAFERALCGAPFVSLAVDFLCFLGGCWGVFGSSFGVVWGWFMWYLLEAYFGYRIVPVWPISAKLALIKIQLTLISGNQNPINA